MSEKIEKDESAMKKWMKKKRKTIERHALRWKRNNS